MRIDIIEDDPVFNRMIEHIVRQNNDYDGVTHYTGKSFISNLSASTDVVTLDLGLPDISGTRLMQKIKDFNSDIEVIIISGQDNISLAVRLLKEGASDYITKDENIKDRLQHALGKIYKNKQLKQEVVRLKQEVSGKYNFRQAIIGNSPAIKNTFSLIEKAIIVPNMNISLQGETGTGKELTAKTIHFNSPRKEHPFVTLAINSMPKEQIKSCLFGIEKGAFADALMSTRGKIEEAGEGTLFLDEITDLDADLQLSLLDILQERSIKRIGGENEIPIQCRIITATSNDILQAVRKKEFREDLYYQLMGLPITIPPLRERGKDIIALSKFFLKEFCLKNNLPLLDLSNGAQKKLLTHTYPGNIRELKSIIELGAVLTKQQLIEEEHIVFNHSEPVPKILGEELTLKEYNQRIILHFLKKYKNVMEVAARLNIGKSTIYNLLKQKDNSITSTQEQQ
jgi:two-component system response regulator AtoC